MKNVALNMLYMTLTQNYVESLVVEQKKRNMKQEKDQQIS